MGQSTNAILFYGFCWSDEATLIPHPDAHTNGDQPEWQEVIALERGHANPWDSYPVAEGLPYAQRRAIQEKWMADNDAAISAWHAAKKAIEEEFGCNISSHCSGECPMPYVYVTTSRTLAYRGCPEQVVMRPRTMPDWDMMLTRFMTELGIALPGDQTAPSWWLVSDWN